MKNSFNKILGIDPGLTTTGFAFIEKEKNKLEIKGLGIITTKAKTPLSERLNEIGEEFEKIIKKHKPDVVSIEKLVFVQNVTSGMAVAHARGVILSITAGHGIPCREVFPKDVKMAVCGFGNAPKIQVQRMVQKIFNLAKIPKPDDAADALAVAYAIAG